jgi:hypothetical protein
MNEKFIIYGLINPIDDTCFYVGQTKKGLKDRLRQHIKDKQANYYKHLIISDILKAGLKPRIKEIFTIEDYYIPELDINYWQYVEMYCMIYIKDVLKHPLTNIAIGGYTCWDNKRNKKIKQYDLYGNYIKTFKSISSAARIFKDKDVEYAQDAIRGCCRGKFKKVYEYQWCYVGEEDKILNDANIKKEYEHSPNVMIGLIIKENLRNKKKEEILKRKEEANSPEAIKEKQRKYKEAYTRSNNTEASKQRRKECKKKYNQTPEGKEKRRLERQRYRQDPAHRELLRLSKKRCYERKKLEKELMKCTVGDLTPTGTITPL